MPYITINQAFIYESSKSHQGSSSLLRDTEIPHLETGDTEILLVTGYDDKLQNCII